MTTDTAPSAPAAARAGHVPQPDHDVLQTLAARLRRETRGEVLFDAASRGRYATDASIYQTMPVGVLVPSGPEDIAVALQMARELRVPVLPRGGGTSQCGQTTGAALVIDTTKHVRRLLSVDAQRGEAVVEPGIVLDHLNAHLKKHRLWYPVDVSTSAQATLGGMAGNNSCGSRSIAYGNMVHNVDGIEAWMADGEVVQFGPVAQMTGRAARIARFVRDLAGEHRREIDEHWPTVLRRVAGYNLDIFDCRSERPYTADGSVNLAHLLVGSEGTLAFTKSLTLKLSELPPTKVLGVVNFPTFHAAMDAAQHIVRLGPTAVELVDRTMIGLSLDNPAFRPVIEDALIGQPAAILLVEFSGASKADIEPGLDRLDELMGDLNLPGSVVRMVEDARQKALWEVRKAGLNIMMSLRGDGKPVSFIEDCAVPLEHLAEYTDRLTEVFARHGTRGTWYAHASVGTLHVRPILDMRQGGPHGGAAKMRAIAEEAAELVRRYRGAFSGEHGDGICRGEWIRWQFGPAIDEAFHRIKHEFDPQSLFSPGRIVDPPKMDDVTLMRFAPPDAPNAYRRIAITPALDWSAWNVDADPVTEQTSPPGTGGDVTGGFAKAIEMCNNNGHCRKFDAGSMCPSYRVTRDEQHVTRGRANTLRLAVSGQLGADALTGEAMRETMDLCVSCKGCRRECPTGVDMARMKIEFLAQYKARHGYTLQDRVIAHLPEYAGVAARLAGVLNLRNRIPALARLAERVTGLAATRSWPAWRADTFWRGPAQTKGLLCSATELLERSGRGERVAVLFVDTFNGAFETENAVAALEVLIAAGYAVHVPHGTRAPLCCGRTYLATGMVDRARTMARALTGTLAPFARAGIDIVGLEPSCLLTLRDEALVLGLGEDAAVVASQARLFEEFVAREIRAKRFDVAFRPVQHQILLHGHCHQKAFDAVTPIMQVLAQVPGAKAELIDSSCCGMAGAFGYEARHQQVSMQMAEAGLLPAIRRSPDAIVLADGTSCRHQIADGAAREAIHVARFLRDQLPASAGAATGSASARGVAAASG